MKNLARLLGSIVVGAIVLGSVEASTAAGAPAESARMLRAKDLISEDQWVAAIGMLKAAVADAREPNKDEALFWLAHSQNQAGDLAESVESIRRLQREFPKSRFSAPAYSLLIELAQKLDRKDVLWWTATAPRPPATPQPAVVAAHPSPPPRMPRRSAGGPPPVPPAPPAGVPPMPVPAPPASFPSPPVPAPAAVAPFTPPAPPAPPPAWIAETYLPDLDLRVQALGRLIQTDAAKVIPMLRNIVLEQANPTEARRAVFVLAQSRNPDAHRIVVEVAMTGPETLRIVAVRDLALFGGTNASQELLQVYSAAKTPVKQQVVISLGQRADKTALLRIAKSETDPSLRERAIVALGRAGGQEHLRSLYVQAPVAIRQAIITGLFNGRDEEGLIRIADQEKDAALRKEALSCLRLMGTARAKAYLAEQKK